MQLVVQSSYSYWYASRCDKKLIPDDGKEEKREALREVARYLDAAKDDCNLAVSALKRACNFRKEYRKDIVRSCFFDDTFEHENEQDEQLARKYREIISKELALQALFVKAGVSWILEHDAPQK